MQESILESVRSACDLERTDNSFDNQILPLINTQIMMAHQFGVGYDGFSVHTRGETYGDWLGENGQSLLSIKTWLGYQVKLIFDPPDNAAVLKSYQDQIGKIEWMLKEKVEERKFVREYVPEKASFYEDD